MLQIKDNYDDIDGGSYGWMGYMNKGNRSENGLYLSDALRDRIKANYQELYKQVRTIIDQLKTEGIKITYKKDKSEESDDSMVK